MSIKDTQQYKQLKEAMELIRKMKIPNSLQEKALIHLLGGVSSEPKTSITLDDGDTSRKDEATTADLRDFINKHNPRGAVAEIPAFLYWLKTYEKKPIANESDILEIYRRTNIRPPKNIAQSLRDLASKKYGRLEAVKEKVGYVRLSRSGEDFVLYDLKPKQH
jgi:hypothetical protein